MGEKRWGGGEGWGSVFIWISCWVVLSYAKVADIIFENFGYILTTLTMKKTTLSNLKYKNASTETPLKLGFIYHGGFTDEN